MPITPTSTKSKQYQALGIDEIANDIETAFTAINALEQSGSDYKETIVDIRDTQILSMGTSPIELLPDAGVGKYYDIDWSSSFIEFSPGNTAYNIGTIQTVRFDFSDGYSSNFITGDFLTETNQIVIPLTPNFIYDVDTYKIIQGYMNMNVSLSLASYDSSNNPEDPTLGNGTLRVKIYHKTITFGA